MSYNIETRSVSEFVTDSKIKLPRFQRKSTWKPKQNFELAISIFQEYPVGVVIINDEGHTSWLLDGRQRRTALKDLRANPDLVYDWALKYIKFKKNESEDKVKDLFWETVNEYLQHDEDNEGDAAEAAEEERQYEQGEDTDIDKWRQREGLRTLLDIILMVHQKKKDEGKWERIFNLQKFLQRMPYAPKKEGFKVNPVSLREFLLNYKTKTIDITKDNFFEYMDDQCGILDNKESAFRTYIDEKWQDMEHIINVVAKSEQIYIDARIGVILLKNVTPLDAQNIFSRINSGGTQLKAEELLSAKPFWNEKVHICDMKMQELVKDLYTRLGVEVPADGDVVRWDYGATLVSRIKDHNLFFDDFVVNQDPKDIDMSQITLGFKIMSSYFRSGMSAIAVSEIEKDKNIKWGQSIDELVENINIICEILLKNEFFKYLKSWHKPLCKLMGNAPLLEFITILLKDWESKGSPIVSSNELNNFMRDAKCLFDRLVFEYAVGAWKGSGDSKMAKNIKSWEDRVKPMDASEWTTLIESACEGKYNGQSLDIKHLTPILCYQYALQKIKPDVSLDETAEVDHIMPQAKLENNSMVESRYKDALFNLILLPKADNIKKKDKALNEILDSYLRQNIAKYTGIVESKFDEYSDIANIESMKAERVEMLKNVFGKIRNTELSN